MCSIAIYTLIVQIILTIFEYSAEVYEHIGEALHLLAILEQLSQIVGTAGRWCGWRRQRRLAAAAAAVRTHSTRRQKIHPRQLLLFAFLHCNVSCMTLTPTQLTVNIKLLPWRACTVC